MKKKAYALVASIMILVVFISSTIFAGNDNAGFSFQIQPFQLNIHSTERYRSTTNIYNTWKVNLVYSGEGSGTYTRFWLEEYPKDNNVSPTLDVKQGSGAHYYYAYSSASQTDVWLTAENNNFGNTTYQVSGYWDEETTLDWRYDF
ncbi:MAG TPA: hypothetical protein DCG38_08245 [Eubacteriaceae bacterium]|jgi:hypothetical protein|nr:hypothetical protein [Eubacteriaceae bacterium]